MMVVVIGIVDVVEFEVDREVEDGCKDVENIVLLVDISTVLISKVRFYKAIK